MKRVVLVAAMVLATTGVAAAQDGGAAVPSTCEFPNVLIVLDRSGSMADPISDTSDQTKFGVAKDTINSVVGIYSSKLQFGLAMFPWSTDCGLGTVLVPVGSNTPQRIRETLDRPEAQPNGSTPISDTLKALATEQSIHAGDRRNFVVFITDGQETCEGEPVGSVKTLFDSGVGVFVVGFGTGVDPDILSAMARTGGFPREGTPQYYQADNDIGLYDAFNNVLKAATTEICDGKDNDCNGIVDDVEPVKCAGPCGKKGQKLCQNGEWSDCLDENGEAFTDADRKACETDPGGCSCASLGL